MARPQEPFTIIKRSNSPYWYYRIGGDNYRSTQMEHEGRKKPQPDVLQFVLGRYNAAKAQEHASERTLGEYAEPFFDYDRCPHVRDVLSNGKTITRRHVRIQKSVMNNHILEDEIAQKPIREIERGDILDFRDRLIDEHGFSRTTQRAVSILITILKTAYFHGHIKHDVTSGVGKIKYDTQNVGVFSDDELKELFKETPGHFDDEAAYCAFLLAATLGMRRGEVFALTWGQIDFEKQIINIDRAWKAEEGVGKPKWEKIRQTPFPAKMGEALKTLRAKSEHVLPDSLVICWADGSMRGEQWWRNSFRRAMVSAGFFLSEKKNKKGQVIEWSNPRNLRPHSFRHSLNTILRDKGYSADKIRASMGWADEEIQAGYTHWTAASFAGQTEILDELLK